jgi:putative phage-type endonuclease|uniref:YqaJ viral recombinase domain-containing protein n=1 Tax=viral metagenome TaxID=1070528 RepID=A0A6C0CJ35_9ZZZZ
MNIQTTMCDSEEDLIELFTRKEKDEIEVNISLLIDDFIENNPLCFSYENFENLLQEHIYSNISLTLSQIYSKEYSSIEHTIRKCYDNVKKYYFSKIYPNRSYSDSFIRKPPNYQLIADKINYIENKPQPEQRTPEWYKFRHNLITASSAWKALKSESNKNQLIVEKCKDLNVDKFNSVNTDSAFHHGNKYEDVSIMIYENDYNTKIKDFGCIQHDKYKFLGASPDGINVKPDNERYGRMLEIKNPVSRTITGIPKEEYWIQMQLQMETCDLNECDFLETAFKEYDSEEEFINDGTFTYSANQELKGIMIYFVKEGKPFYEYAPVKITQQQYDKWYENILEKNNNLTWIKNIYWRLEKYSCVLVLRNKFWFEHAIVKINEVWDIIVKERISGHEHRFPKKNNKPRSNSLNDASLNKPSCLINVNKLQNQIIYINTNFELNISDVSGNLVQPV